MVRKPVLRFAKPSAAVSRRDQHGRVKRRAGRRQAGKPGRSSKVVRPGQHRRRGRHQSGTHAYDRAGLDPVQRGLGIRKVETHADGTSGTRLSRRQNDAMARLGWLGLDEEDLAGEVRDQRPRDRLRPGQFRAHPHRAAPRGDDQRTDKTG